MKSYEEVPVLPFQPPSEELYALQREAAFYRQLLERVCAFDWSTEDLRGFGEPRMLTPRQVDRLLGSEW